MSARCMPNFMKTCSFLYVHFAETYNYLMSYWKSCFGETLSFIEKICCRCTLELPQWGNYNLYQQHMLWNIRKTIWNLHLSRIMSIVFASFKHIKLPIRIKISATMLQIVYIYMTAISLNLISRTTSLLTWYLHGCKGGGMIESKWFWSASLY